MVGLGPAGLPPDQDGGAAPCARRGHRVAPAIVVFASSSSVKSRHCAGDGSRITRRVASSSVMMRTSSDVRLRGSRLGMSLILAALGTHSK